MRCTFSPCQSGHTGLAVRTCQLIYGNNGEIINYDINELWVCHRCGNLFFQTVKKCVPRIARYKSLPRPGERTKARRISKREVIKELFAK